MRFILSLLTWWHAETLGTRIFTWRKGVRVGEDEQGNVFYRTRDDSRRWVTFSGEPEASRVSPDWHGWLHHTFDENPAEMELAHVSFQKPHHDNLTGSEGAYSPAGSMHQAHPKERRDYEAWQPK
ncbi:MAG: NADH:ubiquinone oxidoreductase subunit NDUFA12 [Rhodobacteraceae bacterium]|nr:NADH:ubiquinone oxidoreductase subunit NDUFA12 [Paracoccaceae bacterium]